jgi:hypothetical protein
MDLANDLDTYIKTKFLAQAPPAVVSRAKKELAPLTLRGRISVDINADMPGKQFAMINQIMSRTDKNRSKFDPNLMRAFEEAILSGNLDKTHRFTVALYEANKKENGWPNRSVDEFLEIVGRDIDPYMSFRYGKSWTGVRLGFSSTCPTLSNGLGFEMVWISSSNQSYLSGAFKQARENEGPVVATDARATFLEISQHAREKYSAQESSSFLAHPSDQ